MAFSGLIFKHRSSFAVLAFLFVLSVIGNCILSINTSDAIIGFSSDSLSTNNSQDEAYKHQKSENVFCALTAVQVHQQDSSLKTKKSVCAKNVQPDFHQHQQNFTHSFVDSDFITTFQTRFRRTCPSEDVNS